MLNVVTYSTLPPHSNPGIEDRLAPVAPLVKGTEKEGQQAAQPKAEVVPINSERQDLYYVLNGVPEAVLREHFGDVVTLATMAALSHRFAELFTRPGIVRFPRPSQLTTAQARHNFEACYLPIRPQYDTDPRRPMVLALANGYFNRKCSRQQFFQAVDLFDRTRFFGSDYRTPPITADDLTALGIERADMLPLKECLMADGWLVSGLLSGVIDREDFDVLKEHGALRLWERHFGTYTKDMTCPTVKPEDWAYVDHFAHVTKGILYVPPAIIVSPDLYQESLVRNYSPERHFLFRVVAARCNGAPIGPLGAYRDRKALNEAYDALFPPVDLPPAKPRRCSPDCALI